MRHISQVKKAHKKVEPERDVACATPLSSAIFQPLRFQICLCNINVLTLHTNKHIMEIAIEKKAQSFRLPVELIEKLKKLARKQNRSLNNFVECALLDLAYTEPNEETLAAITEAKSGKLQGPLDVSSVEAMYKSMGL